MQVLEYHDILHCFVILCKYGSRALKINWGGLHNLCVYTIYAFLLFNGEFKMRHNFILLIDIQGELYHIFTQHHYVVH